MDRSCMLYSGRVGGASPPPISRSYDDRTCVAAAACTLCVSKRTTNVRACADSCPTPFIAYLTFLLYVVLFCLVLVSIVLSCFVCACCLGISLFIFSFPLIVIFSFPSKKKTICVSRARVHLI